MNGVICALSSHLESELGLGLKEFVYSRTDTHTVLFRLIII
jgi:hypothetical protein